MIFNERTIVTKVELQKVCNNMNYTKTNSLNKLKCRHKIEKKKQNITTSKMNYKVSTYLKDNVNI